MATAPFSDSSVCGCGEFTPGWWAQWVITFCNANDWEIARRAKQRHRDSVKHLFGEIKDGIDKLKKGQNGRCREGNESSVHKSMQEGGSVRGKRGREEWRNRDRMTYDGDDDDYNYFGDGVNEVNILLPNKWAEKWRPTTHLVDKGQPLTTSPPDSCMGAHQSVWIHH